MQALAVAFVTSLFCTQAALAGEAINEAVVEIEGFKLGYSSWVETPVEGQQLFKYSRCVRSLNGNWFDFEWEGAGLKGRVKPDQPAFVQYVFFRDVTQLARAELKFGRSKPFDNRIAANFIMNEAEVGGYAMIDAYIEELSALNVAALDAGTVLDDNLTAITSSVSVLIPISDSLEAKLDLSFTSSIRGYIDDSVPQYTISYTLNADQIDSEYTVSLAPRSGLLSDIFFKNRESTRLVSSVERQVWPLKSPFILDDGGFPSLTAASDIVDIKVNNETVASFPVTFYTPRFQ